MVLVEPSDPREPGESFRFIAEVTEIFPPQSYEESTDKLSLVASAGKFGIIFLGSPTCINVYRSSKLIDERDKTPLTTVILRGAITHIATSCDGQTLFVVSVLNGCPFGFFYDVFLLIQNPKDVIPFYSAPLSAEPNSRVSSLRWNPCDPTCIALTLSTGDLSILRLKEAAIEFTSKNGLGANALAWSSKGKQLAVGKRDGTLSLFKPDLTLVRNVEAPSIEGFGPVIDITWFTNTEFFVGFLTTNNIPALVYVNAPKGKPATFANFEDVCYSNESGRPVSYYTHFISEWNILLVFSSNSVEMGLIGLNASGTGECKWCQWFPDEGARASMHFYNVLHETFPLGISVDFTSRKKFPTKDEKSSGPLPTAFTISSRGELNVFFVDNSLGGVQNLNYESQSVPVSGFRTPQQFGSPSVQLGTTAGTQPSQSVSQLSQVAGQAPQATIFAPTTSQQPVAQNLKVAAPLDLKRNSPSAFSSFTKRGDEPPTGAPLSFSTPIKPTSSGGLFDSSKTSFTPFSPSIPAQSFAPPTNTSFAPPANTSFLSTPQPSVPSGPSASFSFASPSSTTAFPSFSFTSSTPSTTTTTSLVPSAAAPSTPFQTPSTPVAHPAPSKGTPALFIQKPVSLSSQIVSTGLHAPSPKKTVATSGANVPVLVSQATPAPVSSSTVQSKVSKESVLFRIQREREQFEREVKELCAANDALSYQVGTEADSSELSTSLGGVRDWMRGMRKTTEELSEEVSELHQKTLEALASYEDANSHKQVKYSSRNMIYLQLRPLDPYSQRKLNEIRSKYQYLVSQIGEVNDKLELQWENYSTNKKSRRRDQRSSTENLHRSVLNLHNMRVAAERQCDELVLRLKKLSLGPSHLHSTPLLFDDQSSYFRNISSVSPISVSPTKVFPTRSRQLKEVLAQRNHTPVRIHSAIKSPKDNDEWEDRDSPPPQPSVPKGAVYEDISPAESPVKGSAKTANPLSALSFMVGNVLGGDKPPSASTPISLSSCDSAAFSRFKTPAASSSSPGIKLAVTPMQTTPKVQSSQKPTSSTLSFQATAPATAPFSSTTSQFQSFSATGATKTFSPSVKVITSASSSDPLMAGRITTSKSVSEMGTSASVDFGKLFNSASQTVKSDGVISSSSSVPGDNKVPVLVSPSVSATTLKSISSQSSAFTVKADEKPTTLSSAKAPSNVVAANPILSAQILKEASSVSGSILLPTSGSLGIFGQMPTSSSALAFGQTATSLVPVVLDSSALSKRSPSIPATSNAFAFTQASASTSFAGNSADEKNTSLSFGQGSTTSQSVALSAIGVSASSTFTFNTSTPSISSLGLSLNSTPAFAQSSTAVSVSKPETSANLTFSAFGQPGSTGSIFGLPLSTSIQSAPVAKTTSESLLAASSPVVSIATSGVSTQTSAPSVFGQAAPSSTSLGFGQAITTSVSMFGGGSVSTPSTVSSAVTTTNNSIFGQAASSGSSLFKTPAQSSSPFAPSSSSQATFTPTTSTIAFGQETKTPLFGQVTSSGSIFGGSSSSPAVFGALSSQSPFGKSNSTVTIAPMGFTQAITSAPTFGSGTLTQVGIGSSPVGTSAFQSTSFSTQSVFGQALTSASNTGTTPATSAVSPFQTGSSSSSGIFSSGSGSVFGGQSSQPFGKPTVFGNTQITPTAAQTPASGSIFGNAAAQSPPTGSVFGGSLAQTTASTVFGGGSAATPSSPFSSGFGQISSNTASPFGGTAFFSGLGKAPSKEDASKNVFGTVTVKADSSQPSIFGGGSSSPFGASVSQKPSAFTQNKPDAPAFGGSASFGGGPKFGGSVFGGSPSFGDGLSKGSVFGGSSTFGQSSPSTGGFGSYSSSPGAASFGALAAGSQPNSSSGFGQLAQQTAGSTPQQGGTSSFTSWR